MELLNAEYGALKCWIWSSQELNAELATLTLVDTIERSVVILYVIFQALGVENEDDIYKLAGYFFASESDAKNVVEVDQG